MSGKYTRERSNTKRNPIGGMNPERLGEMTEAEIPSISPPELADLPDDVWDGAVVVTPPPREAIPIRVDGDVLEWFRRQDPSYQTRMNAVLRSYMDAFRRPIR